MKCKYEGGFGDIHSAGKNIIDTILVATRFQTGSRCIWGKFSDVFSANDSI